MSDDDLSTEKTATDTVDEPLDDGRYAGSGDDALASSGLLSFYDRLRVRVADYLEARGGGVGSTAADFLLLVPDVLMLLARLALDKRVPKEQRALIGSALAYFLLPVDFLPEVVIGPAGYLDDLVLSALVLSRAFGGQLEPFAVEHWSGSASLRKVLSDVAQTADSLVGKDVFGKLKRLLEKKGIEVDDPKSA